MSRRALGAVAITSTHNMKLWDRVRVAGVVSDYKERTFGTGDRSVMFTLEDQSGRITGKLNKKTIDLYSWVLKEPGPMLVTAKVMFKQTDDDGGQGEPQLLVEEVTPFAEAVRAKTKRVVIRLHESRTKREHMEKLATVLEQSKGKCPVQLVVRLNQGAEALMDLPRFRVLPSDEMLAGLERVFGERVVELQ
jgi:DNA polymerase-3 subunit alpha